MKPTYEQLEQQLAAVVAENAGLKAFGDKLNDMHNDLNGEGIGIQGRAEVASQQIALEAAMDEFDTIKTPATDAYLAEVRAQGVEMAIEHIEQTICPNHETILHEFAAKLRQGAAR